IRSSPAARLFIGTPLYVLYLRALGAKIGPGVVIFSRRVPVCTDLLTIGAGAVIRREAIFNCYRAQAGRIETGPVTLGRDAFVGERSVLDINTSSGDGAQLGHASALHHGRAVPAGERWHGVEALIFSLVLFFGLTLVGLLLTVAVSRVLNAFIKPDMVYPLYGFHDAAHRAIARIGTMKFFTYLFGDSSYIVHFLQWLGYRLSPVLQTGVNFGTEVRHANPSLSAVGTGTMVADGLHLVNDEV